MQERSDQQLHDWRRPFWLALLVVASVALSLGFSCATPFAAFCAVAALTLPRRDAYCLTGGVWLANQAIGFAFLNYPRTWDCLAWGVGIGLAALLSTLVARQTTLRLRELHAVGRTPLVFLLAFAAYGAALLGLSLWLGGTENFTLAIQLKIFAINAITLVGLLALHRAGVVIGVAYSPALPETGQHA